MSKITMDISEFKALEKNAELAEKYAESLKTAKEENERLQQQLRDKDLEKIKDLEDKSKSVVYIKKQIVEERKLVLRDKKDILKYLAHIAYRHQQESGGRLLSSMQDTMYSREFDRHSEDYIHAMFRTVVEKREFGNEVVERKNLDTVIATIREEEKQKLDAEVKAKLKRLETLEEKLDDADATIRALKERERTLVTTENKHVQQLEAHQISQKKTMVGRRMMNTVSSQVSKYNYFTAYKNLREIHDAWLALEMEWDEIVKKQERFELMNDL